jgi:hypothetical protein
MAVLASDRGHSLPDGAAAGSVRRPAAPGAAGSGAAGDVAPVDTGEMARPGQVDVTALASRRAVAYVVTASVLFAACNVAWRFGSGSTTAVVAFRAGLGAAVGWLITRRQGADRWTTALRSSSARWAVLSSAAALLAAGTMFRSLDGPLAAMALACTPAVALALRDRVGPLAALAAAGSSLAAIVGLAVAARSGTGGIGWTEVAAAVLFVGLEVWSMRAGQLAVEEGVDPASLVTATMVVAAVALGPFAVVDSVQDSGAALASAVVAAFVVAALGTVGRVLRVSAMPAAGVASVAAASQITALGTAVGGVVVLGDDVSIVSLVCTAIAAVLGALAVVVASSWRLRRDARLAAPLHVAGVDAGEGASAAIP